jgi:hypothetical protein
MLHSSVQAPRLVYGLKGLGTRLRAGWARQISYATGQAVISAALRKPKTLTHWSARRVAKPVGPSSAALHRVRRSRGRGTASGACRLERAVVGWLAHWSDRARLVHRAGSTADIKRSLDSTIAIYGTQQRKKVSLRTRL